MKLYNKDNVNANLFECKVQEGGTRITFCEDYVDVECKGNDIKLSVDGTKILEIYFGIVIYLHPDYIIDIKEI